MKEFEFKNIAGTEDMTIPEQLDNFETITTKLTDNSGRLFDFSLPIEDLTVGSTPIYTYGGQGWQSIFNKQADLNSENLRVDNTLLLVNGDTDYDYVPQSFEKSISGESDVPYWDSNAAMFIGHASPGTLSGSGSAALDNDLFKTFRSGYVELTIKTNKDNCIIAVGNAEFAPINEVQQFGALQGSSWGVRGQFAQKNSVTGNSGPVEIDSETLYKTDDYSNFVSSHIVLENGKLKLTYSNKYGNNKQEFSISGNSVVSDNEWHHIIINFGKPGTIREHGKKYNDRFVEFWIDGQLDKSTTEYVNDSQVIFPVYQWLMMDPALMADVNKTNVNDLTDYEWIKRVYNIYTGATLTAGDTGGPTEYEFNNFVTRNFDKAVSSAFRGSINTYFSEINVALDKFEIKSRYSIWSNGYKSSVPQFTAKAVVVDPVVNTNKKKALKLFWNNLINDKSKGGLELDSTYSSHSFSVTHKTQNSPTEINNVDLASNKAINFIADVRIAITDNVMLWGPGKEIASVNTSENQMNPNLMSNLSNNMTTSEYKNLYFSGLELKNGDRVLLTNQFDKKYNGIYVFSSMGNDLVRSDEQSSPSKINNSVVRVTDGIYKDTSWIMSSTISSLNDPQEWTELEYHPSDETINSQPLFTSRWVSENGTPRLLDLEQDVNIADYDLIVFMNYPETNEEISENFIGYNDFEVNVMYKNFVQSLKNVVSQGSSLYVSSTKLATDLGVVKKFTSVDQSVDVGDGWSSLSSPFEASEPADRYFDTHRINQYSLATEVVGLTDKETYVLTDFIDYVPENPYDYEQYHAKYSYRQLGLKEGNEFIIPGTTLRSITENQKIPGYGSGRLGVKPIMAVAPEDVVTGTVVTEMTNNYYVGSSVMVNPYDDYATTIIVHNNQLLDGQPVSGKIFVNCIEDGYTFSREEYNKAVIQNVPVDEPGETTASFAWQYSTTRLNRLPRRVNIKELTNYGQTTPSNGGGGAFIQAPTNSSNGVIRSETDRDDVNYQSDLYPIVAEEVYPTQEIPVLSMTWLGLQWLAE